MNTTNSLSSPGDSPENEAVPLDLPKTLFSCRSSPTLLCTLSFIFISFPALVFDCHQWDILNHPPKDLNVFRLILGKTAMMSLGWGVQGWVPSLQADTSFVLYCLSLMPTQYLTHCSNICWNQKGGCTLPTYLILYLKSPKGFPKFLHPLPGLCKLRCARSSGEPLCLPHPASLQCQEAPVCSHFPFGQQWGTRTRQGWPQTLSQT